MTKSVEEIAIVDKLADFRSRVVKGEAVSDEELQQAIHMLRNFREKTAKPIKEVAQKKAVKKVVTKKDVDDFFGSLL